MLGPVLGEVRFASTFDQLPDLLCQLLGRWTTWRYHARGDTDAGTVCGAEGKEDWAAEPSTDQSSERGQG